MKFADSLRTRAKAKKKKKIQPNNEKVADNLSYTYSHVKLFYVNFFPPQWKVMILSHDVFIISFIFLMTLPGYCVRRTYVC